MCWSSARRRARGGGRAGRGGVLPCHRDARAARRACGRTPSPSTVAKHRSQPLRSAPSHGGPRWRRWERKMPTHKVGGEVDAFCTRCKMTLAHTILAMVGQTIARVQCNTCRGQHAYRSAPGTAKPRSSSSSSGGSTAPRAASREPAVKTVITFEDQLKGHDLTRARQYSPKDSYAVDEVMDHPTFGFGLVRSVRADKVDVAFKASERTLVHGR